MAASAELRQRALQRYRVMFKAAMGLLTLGIVITALGVVSWITISSDSLLAIGLVLVSFNIFGGHRIAVSTMRLLDLDASERGGWHTLRT